MGVHGLWELLAPVGRRVSVETLAGKRLAIDASIWMIQFMKAMRDERGEMVRNAHILGFFRRICKLLFLRTKPVFVFDGGTPALKRRTVIARRRQRENAQTKIRKTAEKLLLNHLKSMRLKELAEDIENQRQKNDVKGKNVVSESAEVTEKSSKTNDKVTEGYDQQVLDELLAASLAAEEDRSFTTKASTSASGVDFEVEDDDEDEEMILPTMNGKVDPSVLASLPPSMQLDLLVQMREGLMAENRQKYQKVKKAPAKFSELQIQAYLKTVAFRREINEVQKSAAGRGVGGVQTSRIASEANREFIFSSSFTGDKATLASAGVKKNGDVERMTVTKEPASSESVNHISSITQTRSATAAGENELGRDFDDGVETYIDERGHLRVSRVRAMGIRMTRDLQRNLDLMKEIEQEKMKDTNSLNLEAMVSERVDGSSDKFPENIQFQEASDDIVSSDDGTDVLVGRENRKIHEHSILENGTPIEISFLEDEIRLTGRDVNDNDDDDDLFAHLVAGNSILVPSAGNASSSNPFCASASDCAWKEGTNEKKGDTFGNDANKECEPPLAQGNSDESEVDWEEGDYDVPRNVSSSPAEVKNVVSRGYLEEESDIQEAIRRSLENSVPRNSPVTSTENKNVEISREISNHGMIDGLAYQVLTPQNDSIGSLNCSREKIPLQCQISSLQAENKHLDQIGERDTPLIIDSPERQSESSREFRIKIDEKAAVIEKSCEKYPVSSLQVLSEEPSESKSVCKETSVTDLVPPEPKDHLTSDQILDISNEDGEVTCFTGPNGNPRVSSAAEMTNLLEDNLVNHHQDESEAVPTRHLYETKHVNCQEESSMKTSKKVAGIAEQHLEHTRENSSIHDNMEVQMEESTNFDEEMLLLREERRNLSEEQRKLERNAEAVSSEMFTECQELLQMFGLPYIIAPMEAEAQCAYMELSDLVDGVVTDDSDVFLFGARSVYKNIFDDRKYVETYFMKDIETELGLTREQLIRMALLLGSDYTEGVSGIGIVNAIEVVHAFPEEDGLHQFREWLESPDPTILGNFDAQTGSTLRKKGSKSSINDVEGGSSVDKSISSDDFPKIKQIFMDKHRNVSKNWQIPSAFPSETVITAYVTPQVDKSTEPFSWGKPDLFVLRNLCWEKFGWSDQKVDELLVPVLKEYNKNETQLRLEAFYTFNERFAKIRSKRIKKAVKGITGTRSTELTDDHPQEASKAREKSASPAGPVGSKLENSLSGNKHSHSLAESKNFFSEKSTLKQSRKRTKSGPISSDIGHSELPVQNEGRRNTKKGPSGNVRGRGRGRGRGKGRGRGRGRGSEGPSFESSETSCSNEDEELKMQDEITERSTEVRKSKRPRKHVRYTGNDVEADETSDSSDPKNDGNFKDGAVEQETFLGEMFGGVAHSVKENVGSFPLQDDLSTDYLGMGGRFCMDEGEPENKLVPNPTRDSDLNHANENPLEDEFPRDYLKMGGGFCMDEDDQADNNIIESVSIPRRVDCYSNELENVGTMDAAGVTGSMDSTSTKGLEDELTNVGKQLKVGDVSTGPSTGTTRDGLKAMPFLKRKRRKT